MAFIFEKKLSGDATKETAALRPLLSKVAQKKLVFEIAENFNKILGIIGCEKSRFKLNYYTLEKTGLLEKKRYRGTF